MTDPSTKAREIALQCGTSYQGHIDLIAATLREYGEENYKAGLEFNVSMGAYKAGMKKADAEGYRRGIEEAAKVAANMGPMKGSENDGMVYCLDVADSIRDLLPSEGKGERQ